MNWTLFDAAMEERPSGSASKMSPASSTTRKTPSVPSWEDWLALNPPHSLQGADGEVQVWFLDPPASPPGAYWTPDTSEWPSDGSASLCSLAEALIDGPVPPRLYLSPEACADILTRARKRRKKLPEMLRDALQQVANAE